MSDPGLDPLLARLAAGDEKAFETVHARFADRLLGAGLRLLNHRQDAEDAVQQVFISFHRTGTKLAEVRDLGAYLFTALRRTAQKTIVRGRRRPLADTELLSDAAVPPQPRGRDSERSERLQRSLSALSLEQREAIALKIDGELTFAQIGEVLGVSPNTAASRYRLALEKLRTALEARVQ